MGRHKEKSLKVEAARLRFNAEQRLNALKPAVHLPAADHDMQRLVHELQVHQVELEMQNSELRQVRNEVEALLEKYIDLYDFAPIGYLTFDSNGAILAVNLTGADFLGEERSHLIGLHFRKFVAATDRPAFADFLGAVLTSRRKESCEMTLLNKRKLSLIVEIEAIAAVSGEEIFAALRDVTVRKSAEEKIIKLNEELESRVRERTAELERMNSELEGFCYAISHEFRAPIARLDGFGTMLIEIAGENGEEAMIHCAQRIVAASNRLRTVIDSLLILNRLSRAEMHLQILNLSEMAIETVSELMDDNGERTINILITPDVSATGDRGMLKICMRNLLGNAMKFSSKNPDASIEFGQKSIDGENVYFVRDNGVGFDMENAKNIFLPFCKLHHQEEFESTGIGLATVHRLIEKHNGRIWFEARPDEGATFYFTLENGHRGKEIC